MRKRLKQSHRGIKFTVIFVPCEQPSDLRISESCYVIMLMGTGFLAKLVCSIRCLFFMLDQCQGFGIGISGSTSVYRLGYILNFRVVCC